MRHIILLGDSILDNGAYVRAGGEVLAKLRSLLPLTDRATLLARDGAVIDDTREQLQNLPADATHLIISAGGNDALRSASVLMEPATSVAEAMNKIGRVHERFAQAYDRLLDRAQASNRPIALCTIYDVPLPGLYQRSIANLALGVLNDVITREASRRRLPLIDLRVMLTEERHFANAIEPSEEGSQLIAAAVLEVIGHDSSGHPAIYTGLEAVQRS